jgi:hypothetical protein
LIALLGVLLFLACNDDSKEVEVVGPLGPSTEVVGPAAPTTEQVRRGPLTPATVPLPFFGQVNSGGRAFWVRQTGTGDNAFFEISNSGSHQDAVTATTTGAGGIAVYGVHFGTGPAAVFKVESSSNPSPALAARTRGTGPAVEAFTSGGGPAGVFRVDNPSSFAFALEGTNNGGGAAVFGDANGTGFAALFRTNPTNNTRPVIMATTRGTGPGLQVDHRGSTGDLALFQVNSTNRIRFTRAGKGIFNGGTQTGGADVAEAMAVEGRTSAYEPGDVLVISTRSDRTVEKAGEPYSTRVIGVYATKPGVLLTERGVDESLEDLVPVGVIGVIPTKVSAENGPVRRGDLLVTAWTPGYAMRADPDQLRFGMVLGKALGEFTGSSKGVIPVLVNVK